MEISRVLKEVLRDRRFSIEPSPQGNEPLFLLLTLHTNLIGFAFLNNASEHDASMALEKIRDLYAINAKNWAGYDMGLVLCIKQAGDDWDELCNRIEMDPYFCRKFVVDLTKDLKSELGQLPFIPIKPESLVGLKRPISAQTFLQKHDVTSNLAEYLRVPYARGIEGIVEECIKGILGRPEWREEKIEEFHSPGYEISRQIRLKTLEIANFRAYRGKHSFDLDADLIVLYGQNGLGKTSFFDAIDFLCTGGISRFEDRFAKKTEKLVNVMKHLDSTAEESFIRGTLSVNDGFFSLKREVADRTHTLIGNVFMDRTQALMKIVGMLEEPMDLRIDNLVRLFHATHIFGQEFQALTADFRNGSRLPANTVSRMLAFQDYVEAGSKSRKVSEEFKRKIDEKVSSITSLKNLLSSKEIEIKQLKISAKEIKQPESILEKAKELAEKIRLKLNLSISIPKELKQDVVNEWRGILLAKKENLGTNLEMINQLEKKFSKFLNLQKSSREALLELAKNRKQLVELDGGREEILNKIKNADVEIQKILVSNRNYEYGKENLKWLLQSKVEYDKLRQEFERGENNANSLRKNLQDKLLKIDLLRSQNEASRQIMSKIEAQVLESNRNLGYLGELENKQEFLLYSLSSNKKIKEFLAQINAKIQNERNQLIIKKEELRNLAATEDSSRSKLVAFQNLQSDYVNLLDNLESHIVDGTCPACGTVHKSKEELIGKLRVRKGLQAHEIKKILDEIDGVSLTINKLKQCIANCELEIGKLTKEEAQAKIEFDDSDKSIKAFWLLANKLSLSEDYNNLSANIIFQKKALITEVNTKTKELINQKSMFESRQKEVIALQNECSSLAQSLSPIELRQKQLQAGRDTIQNQAQTRKVLLDTREEVIREQLNELEVGIDKSHAQLKIFQEQKQAFQKELEDLEGKKRVLAETIQISERERLDSDKYIEDVEAILNRLQLSPEVSLPEISNIKSEFTAQLLSIEPLLSETINFGILLDTTQVSILLAKVQQETEQIREQIRNVEEDQDKMNSWFSYFNVISRELESVKKQALIEYTNKYGPLTSNIQRRLRRVYGFENIWLHPEKEEIEIRVGRKGEKQILPSDYFSESQLQIVMLSLFLSATLTQNWSSFATVLLDDPVTHFDDLNVYSLIDLIKGIISDSDKKNQFIISTCEDRFYRLMKQKLGKLEEKVIFYKFESMGENGPRVTRE